MSENPPNEEHPLFPFLLIAGVIAAGEIIRLVLRRKGWTSERKERGDPGMTTNESGSPLGDRLRELEARGILREHLGTLALGGGHPSAVVVPRDALETVLNHRCAVTSTGEFAAVLPDGEIVGGFASLADADAWAGAQPEADQIVKAKMVAPGDWR